MGCANFLRGAIWTEPTFAHSVWGSKVSPNEKGILHLACISNPSPSGVQSTIVLII